MKISEAIGLTCEVALLGLLAYGVYQVYKDEKREKEAKEAEAKSGNLPEGAVDEDENKIYFDAEHKYWRPKKKPACAEKNLVMPSYWN